MVVVSGERFFARNEGGCTFGIYGRVKFEIKPEFIYIQENTASDIKSTYFYTTNIPK